MNDRNQKIMSDEDCDIDIDVPDEFSDGASDERE
jgi:hypothetical protein